MIRGPGHIVSFFELFSINQLFFPIHLDAKLKNAMKRSFWLLALVAFFCILKNDVYALFINCHDVSKCTSMSFEYRF